MPLYLRVADGNEADKAVFAKVMHEFRQQLCLDALWVTDVQVDRYKMDSLVIQIICGANESLEPRLSILSRYSARQCLV